MNESSSGLHDHTGYWLRRLSDLVHISFERKLETRGVTVSQWNVLMALYRGEGETVGELADFLEADVGAVSRLVGRLVDKSLIVRAADPDSRRRMPLRLSDDARALVPELIALADDNDEQFFGQLPAEERTALSDLLQRMTAHAKAIIEDQKTDL